MFTTNDVQNCVKKHIKLNVYMCKIMCINHNFDCLTSHFFRKSPSFLSDLIRYTYILRYTFNKKIYYNKIRSDFVPKEII